MAGQTLVLMARQVVDFSYLKDGVTETRTIVSRIPTAQFTTARLLVRVHGNGIRSTNTGTIEVRLVNDASTPEDGGNTFVQSTAITGGSVTIGQAYSEDGDFSLVALTGTFGSMVALRLVGTQGTTAGLGLAVDISVELTLKA